MFDDKNGRMYYTTVEQYSDFMGYAHLAVLDLTTKVGVSQTSSIHAVPAPPTQYQPHPHIARPILIPLCNAILQGYEYTYPRTRCAFMAAECSVLCTRHNFAGASAITISNYGFNSTWSCAGCVTDVLAHVMLTKV